MLDTKLILVEGVPGSGKSTTAQWLALELHKRGLQADWFMDEHRGHPVPVPAPLDSEDFIAQTLAAWGTFAIGRRKSDQVMVLEGCPFTSIYGRLMSHGVPIDRISACIQDVLASIQPLNPVVVFLHFSNLELALRKVFQDRGIDWIDAMTAMIETMESSRRSHWTGFQAVHQHYLLFQQVAKQVLERSAVTSLQVDDPGTDWLASQARILDFLTLPVVEESSVGAAYLKPFTGRYRDLSGTHPMDDPTCSVRLVDGQLVLYDFRYPKSNLIIKSPGCFYVQTLGYELTFSVDESGAASQFRVAGKEPAVGIGKATLLDRVYTRIGPV